MTLLTRRRTLIGVAVALAATTGPAAGATTADATTADATPPAGVINLYTSGTLATPIRAFVITGAFADVGATSPGDKGAIPFREGSIRFDNSAANAAEGQIYAHLSRYVNPSTCALTYNYTAPVKLVGGTGAYAGISGTVTLHNTDVGVLPRLKTGKCNESANAEPIGFLAESYGSGSVSFK